MEAAEAHDKPAASLFQCDECGAELRIESHIRATVCPYCDAPSIVERPATSERPDPVFVIGFVLQKKQAADVVHRWLRTRSWFARSGLRKAEVTNTRSVYLPAYVYGAMASSTYTADIGENYTETETYTDSNGKTRTRTRTKTEWRQLSGNHICYVRDRIVTASKGLPNDELEGVEPFDLRAIRRYSPAMIAGWISEEPSLPQQQCLSMAHDESLETVGKMLSAFMPGDSHRNLRYQTELHGEHIDLALVPLWVFSARYDPERPPVRIVVNGQTGQAFGRVPYSWVKIAAAATITIALLAFIIYWLSGEMQ